jgi:hypothetical protein
MRPAVAKHEPLATLNISLCGGEWVTALSLEAWRLAGSGQTQVHLAEKLCSFCLLSHELTRRARDQVGRMHCRFGKCIPFQYWAMASLYRFRIPGMRKVSQSVAADTHSSLLIPLSVNDRSCTSICAHLYTFLPHASLHIHMPVTIPTVNHFRHFQLHLKRLGTLATPPLHSR